MNPTDTDRFLFEIRTAAEGGADIRCYDVLRLLDLVQRLSSPAPPSSHDSVSPVSVPGAGDVGDLAGALRRLNKAGRLMFEDQEHEVVSEFLVHVLSNMRTVDLESPADRGCLLSLLREASGERDAYVIPASGWTVYTHDHGDYHGVTEGEAIAAALIALAGQ